MNWIKKGLFLCTLIVPVVSSALMTNPESIKYFDLELPFRCSPATSDEGEGLVSSIALSNLDFTVRLSAQTDLLPRYQVNGFSFSSKTVDVAVAELLKSADIKVVADEGKYATLSARDLKGELSAVLEELMRQGNLFYTYQADTKTLFLSHKVKAIVQVPANKLVMMAVAAMMSLSVFAQHEVGSIALKPMVGLTLANYTGCDLNTDMKAGLAVGMEAEYQATPFFSISAGMLYAMQGAKLKVSGWGVNVGTVSAKADYLNIPVLANVYVTKGLALKAGVQLGLNVASDIDVKTSFTDGSYNLADVKDYTESMAFSIPVGISYEYEDFVIDARYNIGLTDVYKKDNVITNLALKGTKNSVIQLTLGYKFDL